MLRLSGILSLVFVWWCLLHPQKGQSQHFVHQQLSIEDGLPTNETYMIHEDAQGYIWIGTDRGVVRYNGYEFETFTTEHGVPDNTVFDFAEAPDGSIWFVTFNKRFGRYKDGAFTTFKTSESDNMLNVAGFSFGIFFSGDTIIAKSMEKLFCYTIHGDSLRLVKTRQNVSPQVRQKLFNNDTHHASDDAFRLYDIHALNNQPSLHRGYTNVLSVNDSTILCVSGELEIPHSVIREFKRLVLYDRNKEKIVKRLSLPDKAGFMKQINGKALLSVSNHGIYEYNPETQTVKPLVLLPYEISGFTIDRNNILWVSTINSGILKVVSRDISKDNFFDDQLVQCFFSLDKEYVLTTRNLYKKEEHGWEIAVPNTDNRNSSWRLEQNLVHIASTNGFVYKITTSGISDSIKVHPKYTGSLRLDLQAEINDKMILLTHNNIAMEDSAVYQDSVVTGLRPCYYRKNIGVGMLRSITIYDDDHVLIGGLNGLAKFNHKDCTVTKMNAIHPLFDNRIASIKKLKDDYLVLSSRGAGVIVYHPDTIYAIGNQEGLLSDLINNLMIDGDSVLWASSNEGVNRIRLKNLRKARYTVENFTFEDGLCSQKVNLVNLHGDSVYVCTDKGLNVFHKNLTKKHVDIPLYINSIQINKKDTAILGFYDLSYKQNVIDIYFSGISSKYKSSIRYKYRLGKSGDWNYTTNRSIQLLSLPPDRYDLEIYASTPDGSVSSLPARVSFVINPPFWLTWWFMLLCLVAVGGIVWVIMNARIRRVRKDAETQSELYKLENKALSSQLNPHFIFNALTAIQHFILKKDRYDAYNYLTHFATLIRSILKNSEDEYVPLQEEIALLTRYLELEKIRFPEKFDYTIKVDDEVDTNTIFTPSMLIQPYVENAIRHGLVNKDGQGKLEIAFYLEQNKLIAVITDDGIGREKARELSKNRKHRSFAMGINQRRLQLLNELYGNNVSIEIEDLYDEEQAIGTRIILYIPLELSD